MKEDGRKMNNPFIYSTINRLHSTLQKACQWQKRSMQFTLLPLPSSFCQFIKQVLFLLGPQAFERVANHLSVAL